MMHKNTVIRIVILCILIQALLITAALGAKPPKPTPTPTPTPTPNPVPYDLIYGAGNECNDDPIGGGEGYSRGITGTDPDIYRIVSSKPELIDALATCPAGKIVFVAGNANIDLSGTWELSVNESVTLASDRGYQGSSGARLFQNRVSQENYNASAYYHFPLQMRDNARITGIRLEGPDKTTTMPSPMNMCRQGIMVRRYRNWEIDNCEIWGWSWAGIYTLGTAIGSDIHKNTNPSDTSPDALKQGGWVHHNYIHHCEPNGLGYGVDLDENSVALIEGNKFDNVRHVIASEGYTLDSYEARYNIIGEHSLATYSHRFDMHADPSAKGRTQPAGNFISIHHNTVMTPFIGSRINTFGVDIQGVPRTGAYIDHNWFYSSQPWSPTMPAAVITENNRRGEKVYVTDNVRGDNPKNYDETGPVLIL